jgi:hypothetical protein
MSSERQIDSGKVFVAGNVYTVILAFALAAVLAVTVFAACNCYMQYGVIF